MNKEQSLNKLVSQLPEDIIRHIYEEYFSPKQKFDRMIDVLKSEPCRNLCGCCNELSELVKEMFETKNADLLLYALKHGKEYKFDVVYRMIIIENSKYCHLYDGKYFALTDDKYISFALSWMFILYYH
jgi:hypothetical protein